jgi:prefoldin subunit 5
MDLTELSARATQARIKLERIRTAGDKIRTKIFECAKLAEDVQNLDSRHTIKGACDNLSFALSTMDHAARRAHEYAGQINAELQRMIEAESGPEPSEPDPHQE